jgi:TetR/AcrR family hemagglutinin/protease transcriptional regulator
MRTADRRAQLVDRAIGVFARDGIGRATHAAIAEDAGVSVATVFVHFPTREALVRDVLEVVDGYFSEMIQNVLDSQADARAALLALARAFAGSIDTHPDHVRVWLDWSTAVRDQTWPGWLDFQRRTLDRIRDKIRDGIRAGTVNPNIDVDAAARIFNGASHIVALMKFDPARPADVDHMLVHLVDSALHLPLPEGSSA